MPETNGHKKPHSDFSNKQTHFGQKGQCCLGSADFAGQSNFRKQKLQFLAIYIFVCHFFLPNTIPSGKPT